MTVLFILLSLLTIIFSLQVENQLSESVQNYPDLADASPSRLNGLFALTIVDNSSGTATITKYNLMNQSLIETQTYNSNQKFNTFWNIQQLQSQFLSFPIANNAEQQLYHFNIPEPFTSNQATSTIFRTVLATKKNILFFSTVSGEVGYSFINQLKVGIYHLLTGSHHVGNTFLSISSDEKYISSSDGFTGLISIWSVENLYLKKQIWINQTGVRTHCWSMDSLYLFVIGFSNGNFYSFNVNTDFSLSSSYFTNISHITSSFYYYETNEIVALSHNLSALVVFSLNGTFTLTFLPFLEAEKLSIDQTYRYFVTFNHQNISLFKLTSFCNDNQYYDRYTNSCILCTPNCLLCNPIKCFYCKPNYEINYQQTLCTATVIQIDNTTITSPLIEGIYAATFTLINQTIGVPGHRQFMSVFFELFSNFDHLVLYIYHNRTYGPSMQAILMQIHDSIDYRFQIISNDICKDYLGLDFNQIQQKIDFKLNYSLPSYANLENNGEGFLQSNIQYFFLNIPLIILMLFLYRTAFKLLFNYRISVLLRKFSFGGIIILLLLQGNIQFFFFSFTADFLTFFSVSFFHKYLNVLAYLLSSIFLALLSIGFLNIYLTYKKNSIHLYQNCEGMPIAALYFIMINGVLNLLRGMVHRSAISMPTLQACLLMLIQMGQASAILWCWKGMSLFKSNILSLLFLSGSFSRTIFTITLIFSNSIELQLLDVIHISIFLFNVLTFFMAIFHSIYQVIQIIKRAISSNGQKQLSNNSTKTVQPIPTKIFDFRKNIHCQITPINLAQKMEKKRKFMKPSIEYEKTQKIFNLTSGNNSLFKFKKGKTRMQIIKFQKEPIKLDLQTVYIP